MSGIPYVPTGFMLSAMRMQAYNAEHLCNPEQTVVWDFAGASEHASARNGFAQQLQGDWLLMLDCDHVFAPDLLHRLLATMYHEGPDKPLGVVCAAYLFHQLVQCEYRPMPFIVAGQWRDELGEGARSQIDYVAALRDGQIQPDHTFQVGWAGGCGMLIHRTVFERIANELGEEPFDQLILGAGRIGEDLSFCWRCRKLGIGVWLNPTIEVPHLDVMPRGIRDLVNLDTTPPEPTPFFTQAHAMWKERNAEDLAALNAVTPPDVA